MRVLCVHAHFDDYEFTCGGLFELWRRKLGKDVRCRVVICTDGKAGHQFRTREETGRMRLAEQEASARIGGYEFVPLRLPDGKMPREACLQVDIPLLAALWKAIRDFEPDYLFCPPVASHPLSGMHVDHDAVGEAVRKVAYMINVPHAFTPEYPADETTSKLVKVPVIINTYDPYLKVALRHDLAVDIDPVFDDVVCPITWCHQSQIAEWLPWVSSPSLLEAPKDLADWRRLMRARYAEGSAELDIAGSRPYELFCVTAWGTVPDPEQVIRDLPGLDATASNYDQLRERFARRVANARPAATT